MDERLEAGRHHLSNGEEAVKQGYPDDARMYFEAALLQFRGPALRLGEAHAQRGLAQVAVTVGDTVEAERRASAAALGYRDLCQQLDVIDPEGLSTEMRDQGRAGEAASLVLRGEVLVRLGRHDEARATLGRARVLGTQLGQLDEVAGVWIMMARLAMREGRYADAEDTVVRALDTYRETENVTGQVGALLLASELERLQGKLADARELLDVAEPLATTLESPMQMGRVMAALGALSLQMQDHDGAMGFYERSLAQVRRAGDHEMEGFCLLGRGEVRSRLGRPGALADLIAGARLLSGLNHRHGVAGALLRLSEHGLRTDLVDLSLVGAESARQLFMTCDPRRGAGQAGRMLVKALAARQQYRAVLLAAAWRLDTVGDTQPTARAVLDYYLKRTPTEWWPEIDGLGVQGRATALTRGVAAQLTPVLAPIGVAVDALADVRGAVSVVEALALRLPEAERAAAPLHGREPAQASLPDDEDTETHAFAVLGLGSDADETVGAVLVLNDKASADEEGA